LTCWLFPWHRDVASFGRRSVPQHPDHVSMGDDGG